MPGAALGDGQVHGAGFLILKDLLRGLPDLWVHGAIVDHGHLVRRGIGQDDFLIPIEHRQRRGRALDRKMQALAHGGDLVCLGIARALAACHALAHPGNQWQRHRAGNHAREKDKN